MKTPEINIQERGRGAQMPNEKILIVDDEEINL